MKRSFFPEYSHGGIYRIRYLGDLTERLHPQEAEYIRQASSKRVREFTAGRLCARQALAQLGVSVDRILRDERRAPIWPANVTGSISHSGDLCATIVALTSDYRAIGLDLEQIKPLKSATVKYICNEDELTQIQNESNPDLALLIFSAKEAVYKCLAQYNGWEPGFRGVSIRLVDQQRFSVVFHNPKEAPPVIEGSYRIGRRYVYSIALISE